MRRSGTHGTRKAPPKTPEEVESALVAEMEVTHQLAHEVDSIVGGQADPGAIAHELNRERQLRGQLNEEDPMAEEKETGREKKKKRAREDEEGTQVETAGGTAEKRRKKKKKKATDADEVHTTFPLHECPS
jgi:hypothetical protein